MILDWIVEVAERLVVIGIGSAVLYLVVRFTLAISSPSDSQLLQNADKNWKALLILLVPLFYPTIKRFLKELKKGPFGLERAELPGTMEPEEKRPLPQEKIGTAEPEEKRG
jgi:hypothetical protein